MEKGYNMINGDHLHFGNDKLTITYKNNNFTIAKRFLDANPTGWSNLHKLKRRYLKKLIIYDIMSTSNDVKELKELSNKLTDNEFEIQELFGFTRDIKYHRFWEEPKCKCPKLDNLNRWPHGNYIINKNCPIHWNKNDSK